ncbi:hypothetical protein N9Y18_06255 [Litoricolaceae bacterium]|nr:hypothetical protein [Litorivicinaceae bacterium]
MNRLSFLTQCLIFILLAGCGSLPSDEIAVADISPQQFNTLSCEELETEMADLAIQLEKTTGERDADAETDRVISQVGIIMPLALFWKGGTKEEEAEFGYLKGRYEAVARAAHRKRCGRY